MFYGDTADELGEQITQNNVIAGMIIPKDFEQRHQKNRKDDMSEMKFHRASPSVSDAPSMDAEASMGCVKSTKAVMPA